VGPECPAPPRPWAAHVLEIFEEETMQDLTISRGRSVLTCRGQCKGELRAAAPDFE
jgi:hypothetical protein